MLAFEQQDIGFTQEKGKLLEIERLKSCIENDSVPEIYLETCFFFLVGVFWVKFTPLFPRVQQTLQALVRDHPENFLPRLFSLLESMNYLT